MAYTISDKMRWMFKISYENVTRIKTFQIQLKNDYANDVDKMICHCIHNVIIKWFYNDFKMTININSHKELWHVGNWFQLKLYI
jgi:hypothetical protein